MENLQHLAIASVPIQKWNNVFDETQAFRNGTLFPELHMPFYVTELDKELKKISFPGEKSVDAKEKMLLQIQKTGFVLDDLRLYMDTHPENQEGLKFLKETIKRKKELMREFAVQFYPLTPDCMADSYEQYPEECYLWPAGKIPWEGACS